MIVSATEFMIEKYIARRGPSISPINSSIAFRLRPITIYLRGRGVTPPMDPEEEKKERKGRPRIKRGQRRRAGEEILHEGDHRGPGVRDSV